MERTQLKTTQLGAPGLEITRAGFGAWAIGGEAIAPVETLQPPYSLVAREVEDSILPAVGGAITGFRRPDQVAPILAAANLELDDQEIATIEGKG
jgi:aryl-alcohol dehydrogenase-like predicted oxidoreductase